MHKFNDEIGIVTFPTRRWSSALETRARQLSHFMHRVQQWYTTDLGLTRVTQDPLPLDDPEDIPWRMERLLKSGLRVERSGLQFVGAFALTGYGKLSQDKDAMKGLLVLRKQSLCNRYQGHQPTEILEWDAFGPPGLGRALLQEGMQHVHPDDMVTADVAKPNEHAMQIYDHYNFTKDMRTGPQYHGMFNTYHVRLQTPAAELQELLGVAGVDGSTFR